ncbi:hypothetical protein SCLCIDRAFT_124235 [Scleroderma citrinum Foug A]|uniref:HAT C-terminal dimerisation domain-containing protein n=1 Tax=Scleroderma citrinum Foug A TaxID=1036808 RepID=A0A0C3DI76_9AGAM|nr:hypothetical protein SCLCIDRAFT_124235 [Scleroderma citrinum Foug A]
MYPHLSCMALDHLTIPATSVDVERLFSSGHLLLSHVHSGLSAQTTHALLCLGLWSPLNLIKTSDVEKVVALPEVIGEDKELDDGWDCVSLDTTQL